jgi:hypothetical protein
LFMGPRISGFDDIHQGGGERSVRPVTLRIFVLYIQYLRPASATGSRQKYRDFHSQLYWTGIAELKGQAPFPAAFSWPDAGLRTGLGTKGEANNVRA